MMDEGQSAESNVCYQLPFKTVLRLTGADRQKWLHNFCTADIKGLEPGKGTEAFFLNVKGKTIAHGIVITAKFDITLLITGHPEIALQEQFEKYIITEDVQIDDLGETHQLWYAAGDRIDLLHEKMFPADCDVYSHALIRDHAVSVVTEIGGKRDWLLLVAGQQNVSGWFGGLQTLSEQEFQRIRLANRWPVTGVDITLDNLPQEICRSDQAISFTKGCYLGQETVARIDAIGHVNYFFVLLLFDGDVEAAGVELSHDGKNVGRVTSAVVDESGQTTLAAGFVRRLFANPGTSFESSVGTCRIES